MWPDRAMARAVARCHDPRMRPALARNAACARECARPRRPLCAPHTDRGAEPERVAPRCRGELPRGFGTTGPSSVGHPGARAAAHGGRGRCGGVLRRWGSPAAKGTPPLVRPAPPPPRRDCRGTNDRRQVRRCRRWPTAGPGVLGEGSPTVLLETGGTNIEQWAGSGMVTELSGRTRVCTYDRAGTGTSDPAPNERRDADDAVATPTPCSRRPTSPARWCWSGVPSAG